jgi:hypothetical protein
MLNHEATNAVGGLRVWTFPRRGSVLQPRVAVLGYPGKGGGELLESLSFIEFTAPFNAEHCHNPVGVAKIIAAIPKVAEYSNPWALGRNHYVVDLLKLLCSVIYPLSSNFYPRSSTLELHSYLSAIIGSTFVARRAGIQHAASATPDKSNATIANVAGSVALTP